MVVERVHGMWAAVEGGAPLMSDSPCRIVTPSRIVIDSLSGGCRLSSSSYWPGWLKRKAAPPALAAGLLVPFFPLVSGTGSCAMPARVAY